MEKNGVGMIRSYSIKKTGKYNYSITVPKYIVEQVGESKEFYWEFKDGKIYLSQECPEIDTIENEKTVVYQDWILTLNKISPNISWNQSVLFGYNFELESYFFIPAGSKTPLLDVEKATLLNMMQSNNIIPPKELLDKLESYIKAFI